MAEINIVEKLKIPCIPKNLSNSVRFYTKFHLRHGYYLISLMFTVEGRCRKMIMGVTPFDEIHSTFHVAHEFVKLLDKFFENMKPVMEMVDFKFSQVPPIVFNEVANINRAILSRQQGRY